MRRGEMPPGSERDQASGGTMRQFTRLPRFRADAAYAQPMPPAPLSLDITRLIFIEAVRLGAKPSELIVCRDHLALLSSAAILLDWEEDPEQAQADALDQLRRFPSPTTLRNLKVGQFDWQAGLSPFIQSECASEILARLHDLTLNVSVQFMHGHGCPWPGCPCPPAGPLHSFERPASPAISQMAIPTSLL